MRFLIILVLVSASCGTTYKAYQRVAADPFVDEREGVLLSQKCLTVYPPVSGTPVTVKVGVDSADYEATVAAYNELIAQLTGDDAILVDTSALCLRCWTAADQAALARLKALKPKPITVTVEREVPVLNKALVDQYETRVRVATAEKAKLQDQLDEAVNKARSARGTAGWLVGGGLGLAIIAFLMGRLTRRL
jgi:hypothetical protein